MGRPNACNSVYIPCPHTYADCVREFPQRIQHSAHPMCRSTSSRCESHCPCSCCSEQNVSCWSAWWSWISVPGVGYLTPSSSLHHLFSIAGGHPAHAQRLCCASVIGASSLAPRSDIGWPCALAKGTSHCSCRTDGKCSPLSLKCWTVFTDIVRFICNHRVACGAPHVTRIDCCRDAVAFSRRHWSLFP